MTGHTPESLQEARNGIRAGMLLELARTLGIPPIDRSGYRQPERDRRRHAGSGHGYVRQRLHLRGHLS